MLNFPLWYSKFVYMKIKGRKTHILFGSLLVILTQGYSQFDVLNSGTSNDLNTIHFADSKTGYAGGADGTLLKTHNEGRTWQRIHMLSDSDIKDIFFISPDTGFVVGDDNLFIRTQNGGLDWDTIPAAEGSSFKTIQFVDKANGFVAGHNPEGGILGKTTDSGLTWEFLTVMDDCRDRAFTTGQECDDIYLLNMSFLDDQVGVLGGFAYNFIYGKRPYICKTEDGGKTFTEISPKFTRNEWYLGKEIVSVNYLNDHDVIAIMNTGTGTDFLFISDYKVSSFGWVSNETTLNSRGWYYGMEFLGRFTGYFTGIVDGQSQIMKTMDQGNSFMYLKPPTNNSLYASFFTDPNTGYFVGQGGVILRLKDKNNIFVSQQDRKSGYADEMPYSYASTRKGMKRTSVHIYNVAKTEKRLYQIIVLDRFGNQVSVKRVRTRIYSDEIRVFVKTDELSADTYFYSVLYDNQTIVNGKLDLNQIAHK
jgi:photosystem II stability/assembly factor-like uncharacterized protein